MSQDTARDDPERPLKRMRKGTRSCLSCRKRKAKCTYDSPSDATCLACARHGIECFPQGQVDHLSATPRRETLKDRVERLQTLVEQLLPKNEDLTNHTVEQGDIEDRLPQSNPTAATTTDSISTAGSHHYISNAAPLVRLLRDSTLVTMASPGRTPPDEDQNELPKQNQMSQSEFPYGTIEELLDAFPAMETMDDLFDNHSSWWLLWRESFGLTWGDSESRTLRDFSLYALTSRNPCLLGTLLVAFATCTGDLERYLPPVESTIVHNDLLASSEQGLTCLMALGLCYLNAVRPQRAWLTYHRANTLLQMRLLHISHRKSAEVDSLFWQLWHADRWVSMMTGLPYMLHDQFCDLTIPSIDEIGATAWLHRHLAIISGRVVDNLQSFNGPTLVAASKVEAQIDRAVSELPKDFLDLASIMACHHVGERITRLYRAIHLHQLRTYAHLPLMLRSSDKLQHSRSLEVCITDSHFVLEAYLSIADSQPNAASDGTVLNFTAFIAAVILLLGMLGYGRKSTRHGPKLLQDPDLWHLLERTLQAIKAANNGPASMLCQQCAAALETIIVVARTPSDNDVVTTVALPYFGTISLSRRPQEMEPPDGHLSQAAGPMTSDDVRRGTDSESDERNNVLPQIPLPLDETQGLQTSSIHDDFTIDYFGPYIMDPNSDPILFPDDWFSAFASLDKAGI